RLWVSATSGILANSRAMGAGKAPVASGAPPTGRLHIFVTDQRRLKRQPRHSVDSGFAPPGARVVSPRSEDRQECGGSPSPSVGEDARDSGPRAWSNSP